ncbi:MAG TPA: VWA domain-containing protein [Verrucomicrobiae bacterium]|nr:VWA domain-containing protein [Verrucomicrobiae bacterium]
MPRSAVATGKNRRSVLFRLLILAGAFVLLVPLFALRARAQRGKHKRPVVLDSGVVYQRDPSTGELGIVSRSAAPPPGPPANAAPLAAHAIEVQAQVVRVTCSVFAPDGTPIRGLARERFRVFDDSSPRPITNFDDSSQPASVALVIDASPSVLPAAGEMKDAANALVEGLAPSDEVAVVDFSAHTYLQQKFTTVRELLRLAVGRVNVRDLLADTGGSNIYQSVYLAAAKLFAGRTGRKGIILLTDGQDSGLGLSIDPASTRPWGAGDNRLTFDDLERLLAADDIQVFAVSTENRPKILTPAWLQAHRDRSLIGLQARQEGIPAYTLFLAEIARASGGELYFLNEASSMADTFRRIAQRIGAEYTLGFPPSESPSGPPKPGWHALRVEVPDAPNVTIDYRGSYYIPAGR